MGKYKRLVGLVRRAAIGIALTKLFLPFSPLLNELSAQEGSQTESAEVVRDYSVAQVKAGLMYRTYLGLLKYKDTEFFNELKPLMEIGQKFGNFKEDIAQDGKMIFLPEKADEAYDTVIRYWGNFLAYLKLIGNEEKKVTLYAYYGPNYDQRKSEVYISYVRFIYVDYPDLYAFLKGVADEVKGLRPEDIGYGTDFSAWGIDTSKVIHQDERASFSFSEDFVMRYTHLKNFFELLKPYSKYHTSKNPTEAIPFEIFSHFSLHLSSIDAVLEQDLAKSKLEAKYDVYGKGYSNKKNVEDQLKTELLREQISWLNKYFNGNYVINEETTKVVTDPETGEQKEIRVPRDEIQRFNILNMADPKLAKAAELVLKDYGFSITRQEK